MLRWLRSRLTLRVAILMLALAGVSLYASSVVTKHKLFRHWNRTLRVGVILLGPGGVGIEKQRLVTDRLPKLNEVFTREFARYRPAAHMEPVHFELAGSAGVENEPPLPPDDADYFGRARHAFRLWRYLSKANEESGISPGKYDARIYVMLVPAAPNANRFVEGIGEKDGDVGVILAQVDDSTLDLTLLAIGHEFLHCVGATDKYDAVGHTMGVEDLPEPDKRPVYPQKFAEIMVGEIALKAGAGRLPETLDQVAIGPVTAREVAWLKDTLDTAVAGK